MASEQSVLDTLGRALWMARPTTSDIEAQQLAYALGYPEQWRVIRTLEQVSFQKKESPQQQQPRTTTTTSSEQQDKETHRDSGAPDTNSTTTATTAEDKNSKDDAVATAAGDCESDKANKDENNNEKVTDTEKNNLEDSININKEKNESVGDVVDLCIVDRIYAGKPGTGCDMWYNHHSAMIASKDWIEEGSDPFRHKGGHMLPREALFYKGDRVEVLFDDDWWEAKILRKKEHSEGYRYQVYYVIDKTKQNGIPEERIRALATGKKDPREIALQIGLGEDWQAVATGNNRWRITAPDGQIFTSKKAALTYIANQGTTVAASKDEGDPPWRKTDHEYLGRYVRYTQTHAVSARRNIVVEQIGRVMGWISETDVDQAGQPGFISEKTGEPAHLFHVVFEDEAHLHRYAGHLVQSQDLEEFELQACLIPDNELPAKKKTRKSR